MHYFVYIFNLEIINIKKILTLASQWPLKVVQIHMPHPVVLALTYFMALKLDSTVTLAKVEMYAYISLSTL